MSDEKDDFEQADAAADAALEYARSLPPGIARSEAFKEAGRLRRAADRLHRGALIRQRRHLPACRRGAERRAHGVPG